MTLVPRSPVRLRPWLLVLSLPLVFALAALGLVALQQRANAQRADAQAMLQLEADATQVSALEWEAIARHYLDPRTGAQLSESVQQLRSDVSADWLDAETQPLAVAATRYESALRKQMERLLKDDLAGAILSANRVVAPAYSDLRRMIRARAAAKVHSAALTSEVVRRGGRSPSSWSARS
jgi:hypothetical protein